jgi:hypothetical protein
MSGPALSPREPAPKLRSTHVCAGEAPRATSSVYQRVALIRGYTVKAGAATRSRLYRGVPRSGSETSFRTLPPVTQEGNVETDSK